MNSDVIIQIKNLRFSYGEGPFSLSLPEWIVKKGQSVFIHGPSGSGKSTLLSLISGVHPASDGELSILNKDMRRLSGQARDRLRADHFGIVFQQFNLVPYLSVIENILLPLRVSEKRRSKLKGTTEIDEARRLLRALDLAAVEAQSVMALSVGQQQRVAVARALIGKPELVVADEPTSALDADQKQRFIELLTAQCKAESSTLLFVSHDRSLERHFDVTVALSDLIKGGRS